MGLLETTKLKSVMVGVWWRGRWDVIRFGRDEGKLEIQVEKDTMVDCDEVLEFELGGLRSEPLKECDLVVVEIGALEDVKVPLMLLCMGWQVIDVAGNGGLIVR